MYARLFVINEAETSCLYRHQDTRLEKAGVTVRNRMESGKDKNGTDKKKIEEEKAKLDFSLNESKEEVKAKDGRNKMDVENTGQEKASSKDSKEEAKAKGEGNNKIDEENTRREKAKLDFSFNEPKEEVKEKDRRNEMDEEITRQEKASSKESKEEEKPKDGGNNEIDEENTRREKAKLDLSLKVSQEEVKAKDGRIVDKFHGWEEERSQLLYELGAARASLEIYKELLHDLHHHHQP
ncbi:hypothetical protein RHMOL_Rhmol05G0063600 [Rhododendron molle]|uniref:Uncharacterized protein n=1 Tax=Rhododendron molle TaxID=49168 RepID=A0ACC0NN28_RHOML|nr:hypothetical protein RHMOL_Rhmol05G0063600 [Rhododendron molle]